MSQEISTLLNQQQQRVLDAWNNTNDNIFCTGHGGTGKSWLLECIVKSIRSSHTGASNTKPVVAVTAPTGTAAFNVKGITIHRFAGVGIETENIGRMIAAASKPDKKKIWKQVSVLVIDEISMVSGIFFANLYAMAQELRDSSEPFGGIRLLIFGDFLQLPPPTGFKFRAFRAFECEAWRNCNMSTFLLTDTVRQTNTEFIGILNCVRIGLCNTEVSNYIQHLSRAVDYDDGIEPVKLFAKKKPVEAFNIEKLSQINGDTHFFLANDTGNNSLLNACPAPRLLELKIGAKVMLTRNLTKDLVNGSIGIIKGFTDIDNIEVPVVNMIGEEGAIRETVVTRVSWESIGVNGGIIARRVQIPLILSWAITIHKAQSKTIPRLFVNMSGIFESGQAYVALSRCQSPENLQVVNFSPDCIKADIQSVEFYNELERTSVGPIEQPPPSYESEHADIAQTPAYEVVATEVASSTSPRWVQHTADNQFMTDNLPVESMGQILESLELDSER
jgi:ATP-dependent DNA helicase PIF1